MIRAVGLTARAAPLQLAPLTFELQGAVHALVGGPADGVALVLAVLAGEVRPTAGRVEVLGGAPASSRRAIAYVPLEVTLPNAMRVAEVLDLAAQVRGEPPGDAARRLGALGVAPLADRPIRSLSPPEMRAVAMCEAVTSLARVLLLEEPLVGLDPRASAPLMARLRARAYEGACVVLSSASTRDAIDLADVLYLFDRGALVRIARANDPQAAATAKGVRVRVRSSDTRALLAALATEEEVLEVATEKGALILSGQSTLAIAQAVARAALAAGVELEMLRPEAPSLEELRATASGDAARAYRAALGRPRVDPLLDRAHDFDPDIAADPLLMTPPARLALLRLLRAPRTWLAILLWLGVGIVPALLERAHQAPRGAGHALSGAYGAIALPLLAYAVVAATLGKEGLARSGLPVVRFGANPARVAFATLVVAVAASAVLGGVLGAAVAGLAHGSADPPVVQDAVRSLGIGALGGGTYAAYFGLGASIGVRGFGRSILLVADWLLGVGPGASAVLTPRAHLRNMLGGTAPLDLSPRASCFALVLMATLCALWASRRAAQGAYYKRALSPKGA